MAHITQGKWRKASKSGYSVSSLRPLWLQHLEDSPSGLWRTLGKRVGCKPSGVRIPHPPPPPRHCRGFVHLRDSSHSLPSRPCLPLPTSLYPPTPLPAYHLRPSTSHKRCCVLRTVAWFRAGCCVWCSVAAAKGEQRNTKHSNRRKVQQRSAKRSNMDRGQMKAEVAGTARSMRESGRGSMRGSMRGLSATCYTLG